MRVNFGFAWLGCMLPSDSCVFAQNAVQSDPSASAWHWDGNDHASFFTTSFEGAAADKLQSGSKDVKHIPVKLHNTFHNQRAHGQILIRRNEVIANGDIKTLGDAHSLAERPLEPGITADIALGVEFAIDQTSGTGATLRGATVDDIGSTLEITTTASGIAAAAVSVTKAHDANGSDSNITTSDSNIANGTQQEVNFTEQETGSSNFPNWTSVERNSLGKSAWTSGPMVNIRYNHREATILPIKTCDQPGFQLGDMVSLTEGRHSECCFAIIGFGSLIVTPRPANFFDIGTAVHQVTKVATNDTGVQTPRSPWHDWNDIVKGGRDENKIRADNVPS